MRLVLQELHRAAARLVPHYTREDDDTAGAGIVHLVGDRVGGQRLGHDAVDVGGGAAAHRREEAELVVRPEAMVGGDVVLSDGEQRERAVRCQLGMAVGDRRPGGLYGPALRKIDLEPLASQRFTVPGEETNPDAHGRWRKLRSGATARSRSSTSRSDS